MMENFVSGTEVVRDSKMTESRTNDGGLTCRPMLVVQVLVVGLLFLVRPKK